MEGFLPTSTLFPWPQHYYYHYFSSISFTCKNGKKCDLKMLISSLLYLLAPNISEFSERVNLRILLCESLLDQVDCRYIPAVLILQHLQHLFYWSTAHLWSILISQKLPGKNYVSFYWPVYLPFAWRLQASRHLPKKENWKIWARDPELIANSCSVVPKKMLQHNIRPCL